MGGTTHLNALGATHPGLRRFSMHNPHSSSVDLSSQKLADFLIRHPLLQFLEDFLLDQTLVAIFQAAPGLKEYTIIEKTFAYTASGRRMLYKLLEIPIQTQTLLPAIPPDSPLRALRLGSDFDWQTWKGDRAVFKDKIPGGARDILPVSLQENLGNIPPTFRYLGWEVAGSPPLIYVINSLGGIERVSQILKTPRARQQLGAQQYFGVYERELE
ncbi:hypothetical protein B0H14DRAFT_2652524 [Mycena olivaceomarginata]|nr:hypothetical protein B0H14DRAFT_2652524 [Mycena olivaceomarginata]